MEQKYLAYFQKTFSRSTFLAYFLGRGPVTRVKDTKVSRHQVRVSWDDRGIHLVQTGENPSYLDGRPLAKV